MGEIINHITAFQPVYRILHREDNLDFFRDVFGLKVLCEEGAMVELGGHKAKEVRLQVEESPGFRSVRGLKKHGRTIIKANGVEIEQLLVRQLDKISRVFQAKNGLAFEAISPENGIFLITPDLLTDLSALTEISKSDLALEKTDFIGLSDCEIIAMDLNVVDDEVIKIYENIFGLEKTGGIFTFPVVTLQLKVEESEDLAASTHEVLDLEILVFKIDKNFDLLAFANQFSEKHQTYLDASAKTFSLEVPNHAELWFVK